MASRHRAPRFRTWALRIHLYLALSLGVLVALSGLTGSVLVFGTELNRAAHPELLLVTPAGAPKPVQALLDAARNAFPGETPVRFKIPAQADSSYEIRMDSDAGRRVYVNPYTGAVLGDRSPTGTLWGFVFHLHTQLLAGDAGHTIIGFGGVSLLLLSATGVLLAFRRGVSLQDTLSVKWAASWLRRNYDLHRVTGLLVLPLLLVSATTGTYLVFAAPVERTMNRLTGSPPRTVPPKLPPHRGGGTPLPIDTLLRTADGALPGAETSWVVIPIDTSAPVSIRKRMQGELHPNGRSVVYVDRFTGDVLLVDNAMAASKLTQVFNLLYPTHIWARSSGGGWRLFVHAFVGLMPAVLFVTGITIWWKRRARAAASRRAA